jgi:hypothetical protein
MSGKKTPAELLAERGFWSKVKKTATCWLWLGFATRNGSGRITFEGKWRSAHHVAYQLANGKIPAHLRIKQTCGVRRCVKPRHLVLSFWARVNRRGGCWLWTGKQRRGHGRAYFRGRQIDPRRLAYTLAIGDVPAGEAVSNTCRNELCCRLAHLKLGKNHRAADTDPMVRRFWARVQEGYGCWLWLGSTSSSGYGRIFLEGRMQLAHRVMYGLVHGELPAGHEVKQRCGNRACVRPEHLIASPAGTLTAEKVRHIRSQLNLGSTVAEITRRFGTTASHVKRIAAGTYRIGREKT